MRSLIKFPCHHIQKISEIENSNSVLDSHEAWDTDMTNIWTWDTTIYICIYTKLINSKYLIWLEPSNILFKILVHWSKFRSFSLI